MANLRFTTSGESRLVSDPSPQAVNATRTAADETAMTERLNSC